MSSKLSHTYLGSQLSGSTCGKSTKLGSWTALSIIAPHTPGVTLSGLFLNSSVT